MSTDDSFILETKLYEKELEKKERLIQTYLVIYGLLLSFGQNEKVQALAMLLFIFFLFPTTGYYTAITISDNRKIDFFKSINGFFKTINGFAAVSSFFLSITITMYVGYYRMSGLPTWSILIVCAILLGLSTVTIWNSLRIKPMRKSRNFIIYLFK